MKRLEGYLALFVLVSAAAGCPGRDDRYQLPFEALGPFEGDNALVWSVPNAQTLVVLDPSDEEAVEVRNLPFVPRDVGVRGARMVAIGRVEARPQLVHAALGAGGGLERVELPALFDRVHMSPDGRFALLLLDPDRPSEPGAPVARDANEIAVVDLEAGTAEVVALGTQSVAPRAVIFGPNGVYAAITLDAAVAVLELASPGRRSTIDLTLEGGARLAPLDAVFAADGDHLFVRATGTPDVLSLQIQEAGADVIGPPNFLFATGARELTDILVPSGPGFEGYVAAVFATASGEGSIAALLDAGGDQSRGRAVELAAKVTRIEDLTQGRLLLHGGALPAPTRGPSEVVSWAPLEDRVDEDTLAGPVIGPPSVAGKVAFFRHLTTGADEALTAVSVRQEPTQDRVDQRALVLAGPPQDVAADPSSGTALLGVDGPRTGSGAAPAYGGSEGGLTGTLVLLSEADDTIETVVLDETITAVGAVGSHFYALHDGALGDVTFVPKADRTRSGAHRRDGFLATGILDLFSEVGE